MPTLTAFALNCTLKPSPEPSSTDRMLDLVADELENHDVKLRRERVADFTVKPGVTSDEGAGDEWPELRAAILAADIFVLGTPIWLGHPASNTQRVLERLDAFLGEADERGRRITAMTYWVGRAMEKVDFADLDRVPGSVTETTRTMVTNAVHLAAALKAEPYPAP